MRDDDKHRGWDKLTAWGREIGSEGVKLAIATFISGAKDDDDEEPGEPDPEFVGKPCAYCGRPAEGRYSIERDGFGVGPQVALCDAHGKDEEPSCEAIWTRTRERRGLH